MKRASLSEHTNMPIFTEVYKSLYNCALGFDLPTSWKIPCTKNKSTQTEPNHWSYDVKETHRTQISEQQHGELFCEPHGDQSSELRHQPMQFLRLRHLCLRHRHLQP